MDKYTPLARHLTTLRDSGRTTADLTFAEIDRLVGGLPPSASKHRPWWGNHPRGQATSWLSAGWVVDTVDLRARHVRFTLGRTTPAAQPALAPEPTHPDVDVRIRLTWHRAGDLTTTSGRLTFPAVSDGPALYRLLLADTSPESVYIGETTSLHTQFTHLRDPGPTQGTNIRLHAAMTTHLAEGHPVHLSIARTADLDGHPMDLTDKAIRALAKHAAIVEIAATYRVLNRLGERGR